MKKHILLLLIFCCSSLLSFGQEKSKFYKKLYGSIGKYPVVMDLLVMDTACSGWYYYEKQGIPIRITGSMKQDKIVLQEENKGEVTGTFEGTISNGNFSGSWKKPEGGTLAFGLHENYSKGSVKLRPEMVMYDYEAGPEYGYHFMMMYLLLEDNANKAAANAIHEKLYGVELNGRSAAEVVKKRVQSDLDTALAEYKSEVELMLEDTSFGFSPYMYNWTWNAYMEAFFNERDLLGIASNSYYYSGGAHGMWGTSNYVFDTKTGKEIVLSDIFLPGYEEKLTALLEKQFRKDNEVPAEQTLQEFGLFVDTIVPTENFFITPNAIGFTYVPYEIGPYAAGQIEITIPFSTLTSLLDPKGAMSWAIKR